MKLARENWYTAKSVARSPCAARAMAAADGFVETGLLRLETENFKSYKGVQTFGPFKDFTAVIGPKCVGSDVKRTPARGCGGRHGVPLAPGRGCV